MFDDIDIEFVCLLFQLDGLLLLFRYLLNQMTKCIVWTVNNERISWLVNDIDYVKYSRWLPINLF